ncbi:hypothetical protein DSUL_50381 [Desulfovibrionales bacterium]
MRQMRVVSMSELLSRRTKGDLPKFMEGLDDDTVHILLAQSLPFN